MSPSLGPAPILDFDGTIARLDVDWRALREQLGVQRIDDLWAPGEENRWEIVRKAEDDGAAMAEPCSAVVAALTDAETIAVLTSNAESSVAAFMHRFPDLAARVRLVVGRALLEGPKTNFDVFARGFERCVEATAVERGSGDVVYVGDMQYELDFAGRLGAIAIDVAAFG